MRAIDTNTVVRFLTRDDPAQAERAAAVIGGGPVFIPTSVMLETEWVVRGAYGFATTAFVRAFRALAGLPTVTLENEALAGAALDPADLGLDFADALHLMASGMCESLVTVDRSHINTARRLGLGSVDEPAT